MIHTKSTELSISRIEKLLNDIILETRRNTPLCKWDTSRAAHSDTRIGYIDSKPVNRVVITLRSSGCSWVRKSGGCFMCGHWAGTTQGKPMEGSFLVEQFKNEIRKYDLSRYPVICLYNSGSFFSEEEIPRHALLEICRYIAQIPHIRKVVFESRCEFLDPELLYQIKHVLGEIILSIGIGLETSDDILRNIVIRKGFGTDDFKRSLEIIQRRKGIQSQVYVMVKPPFLTEREAVEDAVRTVHDAVEWGADEIHLEPATIQKHAPAALLWKHGIYHLPWLWSVVEILRSVTPITRVYTSPFAHMPSPEHVPKNCPECSEEVRAAILEEFNRSFDTAILDRLNCDCIEQWEEAMSKEDYRFLDERIIQDIESIRQVTA